MAKKKKSKLKVDPVKDQKPKDEVIEKFPEENPFDFGGIPQRDLKKNLGCG